MTACTNHGGKARRVVTAALVGVLSVGTVPMAALATGVSDGIQTLALDADQAWAEAVVAAENGQGEEVTFPEKDIVSFTTSSGEYLLPTSITVAGDTIDLNLKAGNGNAVVNYYKNNSSSDANWVCAVGKGVTDSSKLAKNHDWAPGTYVAKITYQQEGSLYNGKSVEVTFKIVDADLTAATVFNATGGNTNTSKDSFTYNGGDQEVGLSVDGKVLDEAKDYDVELYYGASKVSKVRGAGDYTLYVYNEGDLAAGKPSVKTIEFTVAKLDLSDAVITIDDVQKNGAVPTTCVANGLTLRNGSSLIDDEVSISVSADMSTIGAKSATVTANKDHANITGTAKVTFNVVATFFDGGYTYDGVTFANINSSGGLDIDLSKGEAFDESLIKNSNVAVEDFDVTYVDALTGEAVDASALEQAGVYYVSARINAERSEWAMGGNVKTIEVRVNAPKVASDEVVFKLNGEVAGDAQSVTYDGTDHKGDVTVSVTCGKKTLVEGTDYEVVVLDETGKAAESIVNAGEYTFEVKSDSYDITDGTFTLTVKPVEITSLYVRSDLMKDFEDGEGNVKTLIPYTGEEIEAGFTFGYFTDDKGDVVAYDRDKNYTWNELPESAVVIDGIRVAENDLVTWSDSNSTAVDALKQTGFYHLYVILADDVVNYELPSGEVANDVEVSDKKVFSDVPADAWYAESVYTAKEQGYINGYADGKLFGPENSIKRGDVAVVLFNMSGAGRDGVSSDEKNEWDQYATKFSDVDPSMYYAEAIGWASKLGIVNGSNGSFRPEDNVTAEEFAAMLANYAEAKGEDVVSAEVDLTTYPGGTQVSSWATEAVEWAVSEGVMGNNGADLAPQSAISRARVAAMCVNYQPEQLDGSDFI